MSEWLVVLSEDNWRICVRTGLIGLGRDAERRLARMDEDDGVWVYVSRKYVDRQLPRIQELRAHARVTGPVAYLTRSPWKPRGTEHFRFARPITVERSFAVPAIEVLKTLSFAGPPHAWAIRLLNAPLLLTGLDVQRLHAAVGT